MASDIKIVFEAETAPIDRAVRLLDNLEAELRDVQRAEKQGLISKKRLVSETNRLNSSITKLKSLSQGSAKDFRKFEKSLYGSGKAARANEVAIQQAGYQVQDFIVQIQSGTNPLIAFSQQGSQLAGFFAGPWGASIGLGIAAVGFLGTALLGLGEKAKTLQEQLDEAADAVSDYQDAVDASLVPTRDLTEKFGSLASFVKEARLEVVAFKKEMMEASFQKVIASTLGEFAVGGAGEKRSAIYSKFDVTREAFFSLDKDRQRTIRSEASRALEATTRLERGDFEGPKEQIALLNQLINSSKTLAGIKDGISEEEQNFVDGLIKARDLVFQINAKTGEQLSAEKERGNKLQQIQTDAMAMEAEIAQERIDNTKRNYVFAGRLMQEAAKEQEATDATRQSRIEANYQIAGRLMSQAAQEQQKLVDDTHEHMMALQRAYYADAKKQAGEVASATYLANYKAVMAYQAYGQSRMAAPDKPVKPEKLGAEPSTIEDTIKQLQRQAEKETQLVTLTGQKRREEELFIDLKNANADADIKTSETRLRSIAQEISAMEERNRVIEEAARKQEEIANTIAGSMGDAFMSIVDGTKSVKDAFRDMARDIIKRLYEILVVEQMVQSIAGAIRGGASLFTGAPVGQISFSANGNAFRNGSIIPYANGGVVGGPTYFPMSGGKTGLMGEAGPEAIMPLKRGKNGKLGVAVEGGGGVTINQTFAFQANGDDSVKKIIAQAAPKIAAMTQKQIMDSRRRGGQMKQVFG